jgi:N-acetylmuramoyl-L-alanine amidase
MLVVMRRRLIVLASVLTIAATGLEAAAPVQPAAAAGPTLSVKGSPFDPDGDGARESVGITLVTTGPAMVDLRILDFDGKRVKTITGGSRLDGNRTWTWKGRDDKGVRVPYGPYRAKATVRDAHGVRSRSVWVTRARRVPYPTRPGAITVAVDPGHGGSAAGAVWKGVPEDRLNLDIGLRLEAMLTGAGIGVVMTRRSDRNVSPVGRDLNGDRRYTRLDELLARNDIANQHRADVHVALHNNASGCHCRRGTEMYTHFGRSWTPEGRKLARALLKEHLWHLDRIPGFTPRSRGVKSHDFKALTPYHPVRMPRPSLQPSVLGESLFLDRPSEHKVLTTRAGRTAIAAAYFDGIARYLAVRPYGLRYQVLGATRQASPGGETNVRVRLTNTGRRSSSGWRLVARVVEQVRRYDGRPRFGPVLARQRIPDGLAPGSSVVVSLPAIPLPDAAGAWLVKLDVDLPGGDALARHGVVGPQIRVKTISS